MRVNTLGKIINRLTNNAYIYSVITKVLSVILMLVYSVVISRYLHAELVGIKSVITHYSELAMLVLCFGIHQAYPFYKKNNRKNVYTEFIDLVFGFFIVYLLIAIILVALLDIQMKFKVTIIIVPFMFFIKEMNYIVTIENPKIRNTAQIYLDIFDIILIFLFIIFFKASLIVCFSIIVIRELIFSIVAFWNLKYSILKVHPSLRNAWEYIKFGFIPMLTLIMMEINYKTDVIMLERFHIDAAEIGCYSLGVMIAQRIWLIPDALKDILLSKLTKGKNENEVAKVTRLSLAISAIFMFCTIILGYPFILILYGKEFLPAYDILLLLLVGVFGMVFYKMIYSYNVSKGKRGLNFVLLFLAALANVGLNIVLIPRFGIYGAAFASTVSYLVCGIGFLITFCKETHLRYRNILFIKREDIHALKEIFRQ